MKDERAVLEKIRLFEKELSTLTDAQDRLAGAAGEVEELRRQMKAIKRYLGRVRPEFAREFPEILKKVK